MLPVVIEKFLQQRAVNVIVSGNYTLPNWYDPNGKLRTFACRTSRVSPFRIIVEAPVVGKVGDHLTSYFRDFGPLEGLISDTKVGKFLLELEMTPAVRANVANKLTWLEKKHQEPATPDLREDARIVPADPHASLTFADGTTNECFIIDMSVSGAAVSAQAQPPIGTPLSIGACVGRVVRVLPNGFAVKFIERQNRNDLDRLIIRKPTASSKKLDGRLCGHLDAVEG